MTQRERVLGLVVGGVIGGVAVWQGVRLAVVEPLRTIDDRIRAEQTDRGALELRAAQLRDIEERWQALTARTLSSDPREAQRRFRADVHQLLELHGLREPKINNGTLRPQKNDFIEAPLTISAQGTLDDILGFLADFYRRQYLARLDKVTISADQAVINQVNSEGRRGAVNRAPRGRARPAGGSTPNFGPDGPDLRLSMTAVTLVLPKLPSRPHPVAEEIPVDERGRLPREVAAYHRVFEKSLFAPPYVAPVAVKVDPQPKPPRVTVSVDPAPEEPPPPPRPTNLVLVATTALDGEPVALVQDTDNLGAKLQRYHEDQRFDDGRLLLIHPLGCVAQVTEPDGRVTYYFYPLRVPDPASFAEREELDPILHPDIWGAMAAEFVEWGPAGTEPPTPESAALDAGGTETAAAR